MDLKNYLTAYEGENPKICTELRSISLALRRNRIATMEELCQLQDNSPQTIKEMRNVGPKKYEIITQVCKEYARVHRP